MNWKNGIVGVGFVLLGLGLVGFNSIPYANWVAGVGAGMFGLGILGMKM